MGMSPIRWFPVALAAAGATLVMLVFIPIVLAPPAPSCAEAPPGLWLAVDGDQAVLSGRAPDELRLLANEILVNDRGTMPAQRVCREHGIAQSGWRDATEAVFRAPLHHLHRGDVVVHPDLVVVAGETDSESRRGELETRLRAGLAARHVKAPLLVSVRVSPDPRHPPRPPAFSVHFAIGSSELGEAAVDELVRHLHELERTGVALLITGHADTRGNAQGNERLSQARADAVKARLVAWGLSGQRLMATGAGSRVPIAVNDTAEGRAQNRRVDVRAP